VNCVVFKSHIKSDYYLFVDEAEDFQRVPESLMKMLGKLERVMIINLDERDKLSQANPAEVKKLIIEQGYFLQLPSDLYQSGTT